MSQAMLAATPMIQNAAQAPNRTRCEVWTRVMGYHRPVANFNHGKKAEHYSREHFVEDKAKERADRVAMCAAANAEFAVRYAA